MNRDVDELPDLASAVLDAVDLVPPGRVVAYGDVAGVVGCGPRQVGAVMARWGAAVAWWRVLRADGSPPQGHEREALRGYRAEGTPLRPDGRRVDPPPGRRPLPGGRAARGAGARARARAPPRSRTSRTGRGRASRWGSLSVARDGIVDVTG